MNGLWSHSRNIILWRLPQKKLLYCIPTYGKEETARFGAELQVYIDLESQTRNFYIVNTTPNKTILLQTDRSPFDVS